MPPSTVIPRRALLDGELHPRARAVPTLLAAAGLAFGAGEGPAVWLDLAGDALDPEAAVARAEAAARMDDVESLLLLLPGHNDVTGPWQEYRAAALLGAFVRSEAWHQTSRRLRVNAIGFDRVPGPSATDADLAAAILTLTHLAGATGQILRLTL